jgi:AcrR family transcriptional regulator
MGARAGGRPLRLAGRGKARGGRVAKAAPAAGPAALRRLRRGQIIAAARAIVAARGLSALTFAALEEELGFSRGVLTYHFADKDEITAALLQSAVDEIDAATSERVGRGQPLEHTVREVLRTKVHGFLGHPEATEILIAFWARSPAGAVSAQSRSLFAGYREQSARLVRAARKADPRCSADPAAMAALLVGVVIGLVVQVRFDPSAVEVEQALEEAVQTLVGRLLPSC